MAVGHADAVARRHANAVASGTLARTRVSSAIDGVGAASRRRRCGRDGGERGGGRGGRCSSSRRSHGASEQVGAILWRVAFGGGCGVGGRLGQLGLDDRTVRQVAGLGGREQLVEYAVDVARVRVEQLVTRG